MIRNTLRFIMIKKALKQTGFRAYYDPASDLTIRLIRFAIMQITFFSHPDCTVGSGISPDRPFGSRALPPVGNRTLPRRYSFYVYACSIKWFVLFVNLKSIFKKHFPHSRTTVQGSPGKPPVRSVPGYSLPLQYH